MKYTKRFNTVAQNASFLMSGNYIEPHASWTVENNTVQYNLNLNYMHFTCADGVNSFQIKLNPNNTLVKLNAVDMFWSYNKTDWQRFTSDNYITVNEGQAIYLKGINLAGLDCSRSQGGEQEERGALPLFLVKDDDTYINCSGNIMSLIYGDNYLNWDEIPIEYCFGYLFGTYYPDYSFKQLKDCSQLILPNTVTEYCYNSMFNYCTSLTRAPELPATVLAEGCYKNMFNSCESLTGYYTLPATTLANRCYRTMFSNCTSLITAPELPATTLTDGCYYQMFSNCTSLITAPELPATTLVKSCYQGMFYSCSRLNYIKAMFTTTPINTYTSSWVSGVSSTGTFVKNSAATWNVTGIPGVPSGWTVHTASA